MPYIFEAEEGQRAKRRGLIPPTYSGQILSRIIFLQTSACFLPDQVQILGGHF